MPSTESVAAAQVGTKLQIAVYGGSALMLASNFRFATEDVDVSELERPLPDGWRGSYMKLRRRIVGRTTGLTMESHSTSSPCGSRRGSFGFGTFLGMAPAGTCRVVPSAEYLLATEAEGHTGDGSASRRNRAARYPQSDASCGHFDRRGRIALLGDTSSECRVFPKVAFSLEEYESRGRSRCAQIPSLMPLKGFRTVRAGMSSWLNLLTHSIWQRPIGTAMRRSSARAKLTGDDRLDALVGAIAEYLAKQRRLGSVPHWVSDPARRLDVHGLRPKSPSIPCANI